jgi:hypothetical protein
MERALWMATVLLLGAGVMRWQRSAIDLQTAPATSDSRVLSIERLDPDTLEDAAIAVVDADPFRLDRRPANVVYSPELEGAPPPAPPPPPPPKPVLTVAGVAGGPPWEAVVDGIPGRDGLTVVRTGQLVGEFRIRSVGRDTVVIQGADTLWRLTLRKPWQ